MVTAELFLKMGVLTKENLIMVIIMEKEYLLFQMGLIMRVNLKMDIVRDQEK